MIGRRRFLAISAAGVLSGRRARAAEWRGRALGAEARILIRDAEAPEAVLAELRDVIARIEAVFSLYGDSELARLNRDGQTRGSGSMLAALALARRVHEATGGAFDPGVQPLWRHLAAGAAEPAPLLRPLAGARVQGGMLRLDPGQSLTLNGIAQGIATDRVAALLARRGMRQVLVDMGEARALDGDFRLELADPVAGALGQVTLRAGRAIATSSPGALVLPGGQGHILGPQGQVPRWSTVSVEAGSAALADAASTGFVLMERPAIRAAVRALGLGAVRLVDFDGGLSMA